MRIALSATAAAKTIRGLDKYAVNAKAIVTDRVAEKLTLGTQENSGGFAIMRASQLKASRRVERRALRAEWEPGSTGRTEPEKCFAISIHDLWRQQPTIR